MLLHLLFLVLLPFPLLTHSQPQYTPKGCFNETTGFASGGNVRALTGGPTLASDAMTVGKCLAFCTTRYAGLEYQRECWCAPYLSSLSTEVPAEECNLACAGNSSEMCGGALRLSLYEMQGPAGSGSGSGSSKKGGSSTARPAACLVVGGVAMLLFFFICSGQLL